jgi:ABC-2 type transport system permease protein
MNALYWSIRRELWENRSLYLAPLIVTAVVLFASMITTFGLPRKVRSLPEDPARRHVTLTMPYSMAPAPIMFASLVVGFFYAVDALYGERRDRSILFWKSMPVSNRMTVLSKASIPLVVLPMIALTLSLVTQIILIVQSIVVLAGSGIDPGVLLREIRYPQEPIVMAYGLAVHALWFAPVYGWLLLLSAWARRAPFLWAVMPPLAFVAFEKIVFGSTTFLDFLQYRGRGAMERAFSGHQAGIIDQFSQLSPLRFLLTPGLWLGLLFAAACLAMAVRLRRDREPI